MGILQGVRVLELGQVLAGPFAGAIFADLGAQVVKVERADGGDDARRMGPPFVRGDAMPFHVFNRGKQSVALDLKSAQGRAAFEQLAAQADIFCTTCARVWRPIWASTAPRSPRAIRA